MNDTNIQWHPAFIAAMNLEMADSRDGLKFDREYNLNVKPLVIDLLITKKQTDISINNEIGRIFRGHNIIEYKNPEDSMYGSGHCQDNWKNRICRTCWNICSSLPENWTGNMPKLSWKLHSGQIFRL